MTSEKAVLADGYKAAASPRHHPRSGADEEQPGVDHAADQADDRGGDQPVQPAAGRDEKGDAGPATSMFAEL
jgi:hypothetical protein